MSKSPLEKLRIKAGLSRPKVSAELGVSERHLYRFERGQSTLTRPYAKTLARIYELPLEKVEAAARKTKTNGGTKARAA